MHSSLRKDIQAMQKQVKFSSLPPPIRTSVLGVSYFSSSRFQIYRCSCSRPKNTLLYPSKLGGRLTDCEWPITKQNLSYELDAQAGNRLLNREKLSNDLVCSLVQRCWERGLTVGLTVLVFFRENALPTALRCLSASTSPAQVNVFKEQC